MTVLDAYRETVRRGWLRLLFDELAYFIVEPSSRLAVSNRKECVLTF